MLKAWGKQQGLIFRVEYPLKTATKTNINVDGALLHALRMPKVIDLLMRVTTVSVKTVAITDAMKAAVR